MIENIDIIEDGVTFTPFYFYTKFLRKIADIYLSNKSESVEIEYNLTDTKDPIFGKYWIDPIAIPLLLCLSNQIVKNQCKPIQLKLTNFPSPKKVVEFLWRSDFFYVAGDNDNPVYPIGKKIIEYDDKFIGDFIGNKIRREHKVRCYSKNDDKLIYDLLNSTETEENKRDSLVEYYSNEVYNHFAPILQEETTSEFANDYVDILSELITNGIMHSESDVFALMFSDKFSTKFSICDSGIGLGQSLMKKNDEITSYKYSVLSKELRTACGLPDNIVIDSLTSIFETLFYSMIKNRLGLFDLMINVVNKMHGYFRLHNDFCQIIVSSRMDEQLQQLESLRNKIRGLYFKMDYNISSKSDFNKSYSCELQNCKSVFVELFKNIVNNYNHDIKFSSLRVFSVKLKGVHVEVEIPR